MPRHFLLVATVALIAAVATPRNSAAATALQAELPPRAVIELFTSQGCTSSTAADPVSEALAEASDVVLLTRPIDYWDYLGWRDTRGSPENSARQRAYARARGDREVFTPQAVINGLGQAVASDEQALQLEIARQVDEGMAPSVPISVNREGDSIEIHIAAGMRPRVPATVWVAEVEPRVEVTVRSGANTGQTRVYRNVVRQQQAVGMWRGEALDIVLPAAGASRPSSDRLWVVTLQIDQAGLPGPIIGARLFE